MLRVLISFILFSMLLMSSAAAEDKQTVEETHVHIEAGVVYCDVKTFNQEPYILKVLGDGSPLTVFWQFDVLKEQAFWLNTSVAQVRLGRQVLSDLVTKRWLMRDLSSGVVHYTTDIRTAMEFLTEMNHAAVVDVSVLEQGSSYILETKLYMHEGEREVSGWWSSFTNWGEDMGSVPLTIEKGHATVE